MSTKFITCDQLRREISECENDIQKRILIIDVRNPALYERSHLCLDSRNSKESIRRKMRVMNIDPDSLGNNCTVKNIITLLAKQDQKASTNDVKVFSQNRRDATDVVIIDSNTDDISDQPNPKSKVSRLIRALTIFDSQELDRDGKSYKIQVDPQILKGGYREWLMKYGHFTTDSTFDPDTSVDDLMKTSPICNPSHLISKPENGLIKPVINGSLTPSVVSPSAPPPPPQTIRPSLIQPQPTPQPQPTIQPVPNLVPSSPSFINKIVPSVPSAPKPNIVRNAPGTAVPVTPTQLLPAPTLSKSHSSPDVAKGDGDELEEPSGQFGQLAIAKVPNINNNHIIPSSQLKPGFDRTLKPAFNYEAINALRSQLNFGYSPEAIGMTVPGTGLQNLGNTCFMNSVIQCLAYAPNLVQYFCSSLYYSHINLSSQYGTRGELAVEFGALVEKLNTYGRKFIEPRSFRDAVIKHIGFAGNEQQDSHEFMMMLFDKLHHDLNQNAKSKHKQNGITSQNGNKEDGNIHISRAYLQFRDRHLDMNKSIISEQFEGIFMSTLRCTSCNNPSNTFEVFNCLSLPIRSETECRVEDCLRDFSKRECIGGWECPSCKQKRDAEKKIEICKLPRILIIHLKRFSLVDGKRYNNGQKLKTAVEFPLNNLSVDYTNVLTGFGVPLRSSYNLFACVNHIGELEGGHYTAFCKLKDQMWYKFDDKTVTEMRDRDVCSEAAYILFYEATRG